LILASRFNEVQRYVSNTGHFFDFIAVVANKRVFDNLRPEFREAVRTSMAKAVAWQRSVAKDNDEKALAELRRLGMQYDEMPASEIAKMREMTAGVVDEIRRRVGAELVDRVLAEVRRQAGS
jgi:TRAP-type C4-dicarboxylate transport system substrate-binding protein